MPVTTRAQSAGLSPVKRSTVVPTDESITTTLASSDSQSSSEDDDDDSDSDSDSDSSESVDSEEEDEGAVVDLDALLQKAKLAARHRAQRKLDSETQRGHGDDLAGNEELVLFGSAGEDEDDSSEEEEDDDDGGSATPNAAAGESSNRHRRTARPLPPSLAAPLSRSAPFASSSRSPFPSDGGATVAAAPPRGVSLAQDLGKTVLADQGAVTVGGFDKKGKGKSRGDPPGDTTATGDKWGVAPLPKLSKKQIRAKQPHTAGAQWYHMPATPMTPELKREIDALRLSNQLDPKKFLRGGAKRDKVGEFFQIGHIIAPSTRATTLSSQPSVQKRSFVEDLLEDEQSKAYAKRKTKEVLAKSMSGRKRQRKGGKGAYAMGEGGNQRGGVAGGKKQRKG
ncbi:hypothetical protein BMF94_1942 [Rhodotorula taiwanensis]|uniref:Fcf2 pre-rRNA processing C-terminal domain-containing protein n=1 Tax=Rhodotorula taiwanensis TaxID=741276 RepID=A0A2S5BDV4_9BASI|nr:hypothetical protein BMF94_1942 [Rhodotorula taiwanensis]